MCNAGGVLGDDAEENKEPKRDPKQLIVRQFTIISSNGFRSYI